MTRQVSPAPDPTMALLEPRVQPYWDSEVWSSTTTAAEFFKNPVGNNTIAGNVAAGAIVQKTDRHTNMETGSLLPAPRVFIATGLRLHLVDAPYTAVRMAVDGTVSYGDPTIALLQFLLFRCVLEFRVGTKHYARAPGYMFPSNRGIQADLVAATVGARLDSGAAATSIQGTTVHATGYPWAFGSSDPSMNGVFIPYSQLFTARLYAEGGASLFAISATAFPADTDDMHRLIQCYLDGIAGEEVQ